MTIREVEVQLGMTRANIRFYEQAGLLSPRRDKNGYRDYSPADVETLRKIKLLRQLKLPVETIGQVQRGARPLADAIREQEGRLAEEQKELEWAGEICRAMREEQVSYAELDARRYLERLDRPASQPGPFSLGQDELPTVSHPWRRYFARTLDLSLYGLLWTAVQMLLLRWNLGGGLLETLLDTYIGFGLMFLAEPLLLCTWGYTPGKWIFGMEVRTRRGEKLTWGEAWFRTWGVFTRGLGWGIPVYNLVRPVKCYQACSRGEPMEWEWEGNESYSIRSTKWWRWLGLGAGYAAVFGLTLLVTLQAYMPIHRGAITPGQYADNINDMVSFQGLMVSGRMDEHGQWVEDSLSRNLYLVNNLPLHRLTVEDGIVTGVRIELEGNDTFVSSLTQQKQLAAQALVAAQPEYNCVSWRKSGVLDAIEQNQFEDYTLQAGGMTIRQEFTSRGYQGAGSLLLAEEGAETLYYHLIFTIEAGDGR